MRAARGRRGGESGEDGATHGRQGRLRWTASDSFFPRRGFEAVVLEEGEGEHHHQGVPMKPVPGTALEVVEAEFLLHLLMRLLADPARLDDLARLFKVASAGRLAR